jgi:glycolate oxidase iron-sulfur subunit
VLDRVGISLVQAGGGGCCGALPFHLSDHAAAQELARRNIDAWWPRIAAGAEAIVVTASGCGVTVKDYAHLLANDPDYRDKAARISALARDLCEVVPADFPQIRAERGPQSRVAFQSPCTLQHGQQIRGRVEGLLARAGYQVTPVRDAHLCCGSAGTYSILQPEIAGELRSRKLAALQEGGAPCIATANIGCLTHLQAASAVPVRHWVELVDEALERRVTS